MTPSDLRHRLQIAGWHVVDLPHHHAMAWTAIETERDRAGRLRGRGIWCDLPDGHAGPHEHRDPYGLAGNRVEWGTGQVRMRFPR